MLSGGGDPGGAGGEEPQQEDGDVDGGQGHKEADEAVHEASVKTVRDDVKGGDDHDPHHGRQLHGGKRHDAAP